MHMAGAVSMCYPDMMTNRAKETASERSEQFLWMPLTPAQEGNSQERRVGFKSFSRCHRTGFTAPVEEFEADFCLKLGLGEPCT